MFGEIDTLFKKQNVHSHKNQGITVANVADLQKGMDLAASILYEVIDRKTVLYLSGGSLKTLYEKLASDESLLPGAVGLIDERYGPPLHSNSNQLMVRGTGFLRYLEIRDIPFYPILRGKERVETAAEYDEKIRELNAVYPRSVGLLGIGPDGHTAGMPALNSKLKDQKSKIYDTFGLVTEYDDLGEVYGERVTMTFLGLSMLDLLIVVVFGSSKQNALELMFRQGPGALRQAQGEIEIPARFFKRAEIAEKTLLITDQSV